MFTSTLWLLCSLGIIIMPVPSKHSAVFPSPALQKAVGQSPVADGSVAGDVSTDGESGLFVIQVLHIVV